jgi:type VII secretion protein EccB
VVSVDEPRRASVMRWSQRDQLTSYQFQRRRLVRSLVVGDPESTERPDRRLLVSVGVGGLVAVLALAVMAVLGIVRPGRSTSWKDGRSIIVEKETGTRFVLDARGVLHPTLNYSSAVLFLSGRAPVKTTARSSLKGVPRGVPVGIPGAPDALPEEKNLLAGPWTACSQATLSGGAAAPVLSVDIGAVIPGAALPDSAGVLVQEAGADGRRFLLAEGRRFAIASPAVESAFGWTNGAVVPVAPAWLDTVPAGPDLRPLAVEGSGGPGPDVGGRESALGEVFRSTEVDGTSRYWVLTRSGLAKVSATSATLLLANPDGPPNPSGRPVELTTRDVGQATRSPQPGPGARLPANALALRPPPDGDQVALCSSTSADADPSRADVRVLPVAPALTGGSGVPVAPGPGRVRAADVVRVVPGAGALVVAGGSAGLGAVYLVTDLGVRYPLASADVVQALGFEKVPPRRMPAAVLKLMPLGPTLDADLVVDDEASGSGPVVALGRPGGG